MSKFPIRMQEHLIDFKENRQYLPYTNPRKRWEYVEIADNLYPPIRNGFLQYAYDDSIDFHDYARHVRSSQTFCFNLFYPLIKKESLLKLFAATLDIEPTELTSWHFEYQPESDHLGEWQGPEKPIDYITSVDLALFFTCRTGKKVAVLCEVKFTETKFSKCGGFASSGNTKKTFCNTTFSVDGIAENCYLVKEKGRKYFELTQPIYVLPPTPPCPFAENNQCQRNHAFAKALVKAGHADAAYFGLVYHDKNSDILNEWNRYQQMCQSSERQHLFTLPASQVLAATEDLTLRHYFRDRYLIEPSESAAP
jgi:hypothetical protein